jgi:hypothetical protein
MTMEASRRGRDEKQDRIKPLSSTLFPLTDSCYRLGGGRDLQVSRPATLCHELAAARACSQHRRQRQAISYVDAWLWASMVQP